VSIMQSKKNWFLRKKDGSEYGPVSLADLLRWSAQCRIVAGNAVSTDREEWTAVEDIPELEMHWMAHRADGKEYGPFALAAVQELFAHNVLPADAVLANRLTGENKPLKAVIGLPEAPIEAPDNAEKAGGVDGIEEVERVEKIEDVGDVDDVNTVNQVRNKAEEHGAATEAGDSDAAAEDALAEEDDAPESVATADLADGVDLVDKTDATDHGDDADNADAVDIAPLMAQIESLRQELQESQSEAAEVSEAYQARIALLEKKLQTAQQAARDASALETERRQSQQQAVDDLADLRKQTAFMKKNIAVLHAELDAARRQAAFRARLVLALGSLLTLLAALAIIRAAGGCRQREDISMPTAPDRSGTSSPVAGESRDIGDADAARAATSSWPTLQIDGLNVDRRQDHLVIRFEEGAFSSLTTLTPAAEGQLKTLVERLRPDLPVYRLVVEGHADNIPMRATTAFADNAALAVARAETGAAFLKREGAQAIAATRAGEPPYPNDTPDNRRRNRTLVIRLYQ